MRPTEGFTGVTVATSGHGSSQVGIDYLSDKGLTGYGLSLLRILPNLKGNGSG